MADTDVEGEASEKILPPAVSMRENLISTAVKFLQNPKVRQSPLSQKKAFLEKKGLTKEEIEAAIERSGVTQDGPVQTKMLDSGVTRPSNVSSALVPSAPQAHPTSSWTRARDVLAVLTMITGISYAAHKLYMEFVRPLFTGQSSPSNRLKKLEEEISKVETSVQSSLTSVQQSLTTIEQTLTTQQEKLQRLSHDIFSSNGGTGGMSVLQNTQGITDIKAELTSIKGLLLNRRQFPPTPASTPVIPSWQLANTQEQKDVETKMESLPASPSEDQADINLNTNISETKVLDETEETVTVEMSPTSASDDSTGPQPTQTEVAMATAEGEGQKTAVKGEEETESNDDLAD